MSNVAQVAGLTTSTPAIPAVANGQAVAAVALGTPMTGAERAGVRRDLQLAQLSFGITIGPPTPPVVVAPAPIYPTAPTYYPWMGQAYIAAPPPVPGMVIIMQGGRYYRVPHHHWENRGRYWQDHHHYHPGRRW